MTKYEILIKILDSIVYEAPEKYSKLYGRENTEQYNASLSRAFIHLFLKVRFDLLDFEEREHFVTDGANDGGIDGYYVDKENRQLFLFQSKFRHSEDNFKNKEISLHELLAMEINRILSGEDTNESGVPYRGKIKQLQREVSEIDDLPRYTYKIMIFANLKSIKESDLKRITGGYGVEIIDSERCYNDFVFPIISGTYYAKTDLHVQIDLSNKLANKISYNVSTMSGDCNITVLFIPTIEVGKFMSKYKNSILKYNPRSYLGFTSQDVNKKIAESIINHSTNEFALFNNGITLLSEETVINEQVAQKGVARLIIRNPQIINGGQTSYTLSRLYEEQQDKTIFDGKEVLLKIITLPGKNDNNSINNLIDCISDATNHQTPVGPSDRISNYEDQLQLQKILYERYGMLYERKKGEFSDGILKGYIKDSDIIDRSLFIKIYYTLLGKITSSKTRKIFISHRWKESELSDEKLLMETLFGYRCYMALMGTNQKKMSDLDNLAKVKTMVLLFSPTSVRDFDKIIKENINIIIDKWDDFLYTHSDNVYKKTVIRVSDDGQEKIIYKRIRSKMRSWLNSKQFCKDVNSFFCQSIHCTEQSTI